MKLIKKLVFLTIGVIFVAIGLQQFLVPNNLIDGGISGVAIIVSYLTNLPLGFYIFILNCPFLYFGYKHLGKSFLLASLYSIVLLSLAVTYFAYFPRVTDDLLLACIFGGIIIGIGLGIVFRNNGSMDGTEIIALTTAKKISFSVGEIIMFFNVFILISAGLVFGWERAMYSLIAFFIAFKTIDLVLDGLDESKSVMIISDYYDEIANCIMERLKRGVTFIEGQGGFTREYKKIIFCVITRLELAELKNLVTEIDPNAFMAIENVHEVSGGRLHKQNPLLKFTQKKLFKSSENTK